MKEMVLEMREIGGTARAKAKFDQLQENAFMPADLGDGVAEKKTSHLAFTSLAKRSTSNLTGKVLEKRLKASVVMPQSSMS